MQESITLAKAEPESAPFGLLSLIAVEWEVCTLRRMIATCHDFRLVEKASMGQNAFIVIIRGEAHTA